MSPYQKRPFRARETDSDAATPPPPSWATRSIPEDDGITHERLSALHPAVVTIWPASTPARERPTDVSVSVVDHRTANGWLRLPPTVQVERGSYTLPAARQLRQALDEMIAAAEHGEP